MRVSFDCASRFVVAVLLPTFVLGGQWTLATNDKAASLRGVHAIGRGVVWASGSAGTILRSEDDGYMWQHCAVPPGGEKLDFRGLFAWDGDHAIAMSSGTGAASKLYETRDGCSSWQLLFENPDPTGFWDDLAFRGTHGFILGDPVNDRVVIFQSDDAGQHWRRDNDPGLAGDNADTKIFAGSNSSLAIRPDGTLLIGIGGAKGSRVLRRSAAGDWASAKAPLAAGKETAGIFSLAFRDSNHGVAVGGDFANPAERAGTAAWTSDGGTTWKASTSFPSGYRSAVAWSSSIQAWIAAGSNGSDFSLDDGRTWKRLDSGAWNALSLPWIVGPKGRIASLDVSAFHSISRPAREDSKR